MQKLIKLLIALLPATLISCNSGNGDNASSSNQGSQLAIYKAMLNYSQKPVKSGINSLKQATQNNQQSFVTESTITLTNVRVNFFSSNNCSNNTLVTTIDMSGEEGVDFPTGTYTSTGQSNLALCNRYPSGGCNQLYSLFSSNSVQSMNFQYTYASGKIYSAACMSGNSDSNNKETILNWSGNSGDSPWEACANSSCGFSQTYNVLLPESTNLTSSFMLVGNNGSAWNYNPYTGSLTSFLYPKVEMKGIINAPGQFVSVGTSGVILTSVTGESWTGTASGVTANLNAVAANLQGTYVAVGDNGTIIHSSNGIIWESAASIGTTQQLKGIAVDKNGKFVAVGVQTIIYSSDGNTWQPANIGGGTPTFNGVAVNESGRFVAVGNSGIIRYSDSSGNTWQTTSGSIGSSNILGITANESGGFVAVGQLGKIYSSTDGNNWTQPATIGSPAPTLNGITVNESGLFVATGSDLAGSNGKIYYSSTPTTGASWTASSGTFSAAFNSITANSSGKFVTVGKLVSSGTGPNIFYTNTPNTGWTQVVQQTSKSLKAAAQNTGSGLFVIVGDNGTILTSVNGNFWTSSTSASNTRFNSVMATNNGPFVACGYSGSIESSINGNTWIAANSGTVNYLSGIAQNINGLIVITGDSKTILTSIDNGISWIVNPDQTNGYNLHGVTANESGLFISVGGYDNDGTKYGIIYSSPDAINWSAASSIPSGSSNLNSVTTNNSLFVTTGQNSSNQAVIFYSSDGNSWNTATITGLTTATSPLSGIAVNSSGLFIATGAGGIILTSLDGINWSTLPKANGITINSVLAY